MKSLSKERERDTYVYEMATQVSRFKINLYNFFAHGTHCCCASCESAKRTLNNLAERLETVFPTKLRVYLMETGRTQNATVDFCLSARAPVNGSGIGTCQCSMTRVKVCERCGGALSCLHASREEEALSPFDMLLVSCYAVLTFPSKVELGKPVGTRSEKVLACYELIDTFVSMCERANKQQC